MAAIYTDIGAMVGADCCMVGVSLTAGVSPADGTEVNGPTINRDQWSDRGQSATFVLGFYADMAATETLIVATQVQDSADGTNYTDYDGRISGAGTASTTFGGVNAAQDIYACHKHDIDIGLARQYLRIQHTVTLSASGTDTCGIGGAIVVGGQQELPGTGREADTGA